MPETVTVDFGSELADDLSRVLTNEVTTTDEFHSTEQVMQEAADLIADADGPIEMRRALATELAEILEREVATAEEHHSTEQTMEHAAERIRANI